jgi:hypothetical protein
VKERDEQLLDALHEAIEEEAIEKGIGVWLSLDETRARINRAAESAYDALTTPLTDRLVSPPGAFDTMPLPKTKGKK